eukprot:355924-Chlamydomonas_euryale.AAC.2
MAAPSSTPPSVAGMLSARCRRRRSQHGRGVREMLTCTMHDAQADTPPLCVRDHPQVTGAWAADNVACPAPPLPLDGSGGGGSGSGGCSTGEQASQVRRACARICRRARVAAHCGGIGHQTLRRTAACVCLLCSLLHAALPFSAPLSHTPPPLPAPCPSRAPRRAGTLQAAAGARRHFHPGRWPLHRVRRRARPVLRPRQHLDA